MSCPAATENKLECKEWLIYFSEKGTCPTEKMACSTASDSNETKPECKDFCIHISGEGSCQIKKMVCPASDSTKIKLECKELCIDIPAKKARRAATDIIEDILTRHVANSDSIEIPQDMEPARLPKSCIFKVPEKLRDVNKKAYNPKLISIGPLHHGQEELEEMELQKLKYFKEFFTREWTDNITPNKLVRIIEENKAKIRDCYAADTSKFESKEFVNMILLDAIFIIELFLRNVAWSKDSNKALHDLVASAVPSVRDKPKDANDYMFSDKWLRYHLRLDLLLLENQLPFFILKKLWKDINCCSVGPDNQQEDQQDKQAKEDTSFPAKLCKHSNCNSVCSDHQEKEEKNEDTCFLAKLWEKCNCHHKEEQKKDDSIEKDTSFLRLAFAFLGSNKRVATLVNDLCLEIVEPEKSQYMDLSERLNKHYGNCWNKNMAKLSRKYFGDFWRGTATVVGLTVLVFTLWNFQKLLFRPQKGFPHRL